MLMKTLHIDVSVNTGSEFWQMSSSKRLRKPFQIWFSDMVNPQPEGQQNLTVPNWRPIQTMYNPDLDCDDSVFYVDEDIAH